MAKKKKKFSAPKYFITKDNMFIGGVKYKKWQEYTGEHVALLVKEGAISLCENSSTKRSCKTGKCKTC